ncbi:MAG: (2Fe-2S)-binding protein [Ignavibacteria bacterium]|jgi:isoquinoline 1-oxidoreductase alpha subunit
MPNFNLIINGKNVSVNVDADTPLLWVLRDNLGLTGTKYSCGEGYCGSCTVHLNGEAVRSCATTIEEAAGQEVLTIEGLAKDKSNPIFKTWIELEVSQCGYCHPGQIMTVAAMFNNNNTPSKEEIDDTMSQVFCRCGTYPRIKKAITKLVEEGGK